MRCASLVFKPADQALEKKQDLGMEGETADTEHKSSFQLFCGTVISIDKYKKKSNTDKQQKIKTFLLSQHL